MDKNENNNSRDMTFYGLLTIAFIILRLCGIIEWPWVWVLAPLWIPFLLTVIILMICIVVAYLTKK